MPRDFDVKYVAHLARIALTPEEEEKFGAQLTHILGYIDKLNQLDVAEIEPMAHAVPLVNVFRPDEVRPSLSNQEALRNAPAKANGLFMTPKIVE
ncbi:MAG TPA: Asp-tRNA(Asn)/Glu-tRNA(Gln) amidotransferase subunit GatC [Candidatus Saccharimonadales bacterium]|jgi:aspartyl-tRNA(Asn)/glutamyl-tRNA(Gln) amidotransferase subunit C|nr:Asp-tRNA(Asn)/Glu-tRNA(Gln) amidotransferase subunit GatC [Candidatus Saccharimonadales bacterium]